MGAPCNVCLCPSQCRFSISMDKTTGVVTSVPSDAPDDYAAYVLVVVLVVVVLVWWWWW